MFRSWFVHNLFAHPAMQILNMVGLHRAAEYVHDSTLPLTDDDSA